jgi:hypothetical protein
LQAVIQGVDAIGCGGKGGSFRGIHHLATHLVCQIGQLLRSAERLEAMSQDIGRFGGELPGYAGSRQHKGDAHFARSAEEVARSHGQRYLCST